MLAVLKAEDSPCRTSPQFFGLVMELADMMYSVYIASQHERSNRSQTIDVSILSKTGRLVNSLPVTLI